MAHHKRRRARRQRSFCHCCKPWKINGVNKWAKGQCLARDYKQLQEDSMNFFEGEDLVDSLIEEEIIEETTVNICVCLECKGTFELESKSEATVCPLCGIPFDGKGN